ncbi:MAG: hypothetical protein HQL24_06215 [Candidatus Omnitrophica bacterium]|nr:hypothetical protein [Candidatus Omnitrophota bacterium]
MSRRTKQKFVILISLSGLFFICVPAAMPADDYQTAVNALHSSEDAARDKQLEESINALDSAQKEYDAYKQNWDVVEKRHFNMLKQQVRKEEKFLREPDFNKFAKDVKKDKIKVNKLNAESQAWDLVEQKHDGYFGERTSEALKKEHQDVEEEDLAKVGLEDEDAREFQGDRIARKHQWDLGWETSLYKYEEPGVMKQKGVMKGISTAYTYRPNQGNFLYNSEINTYRLEAEYMGGKKLHYEAETDDSVGLIDKGKRDRIWDLRGLIGREFVSDPNQVFLYGGFGYRYLNDSSRNPYTILGNVAYLSYERQSRYYYVPLGVEASRKLANKWTIGCRGEYDWFIAGKQISRFSDFNTYVADASSDLNNRQRHGFGLRGSLKFMRSFGFMDLNLEPYFRYWHMEDSDVEEALEFGEVSDGWVEPENKTTEYGLKIGASF